MFTNPTGSAITVPVRLVGNLGSDAATTVFATSDGDLLVEPTDLWFGTDDGDGVGSPAVIHLLHAGFFGIQPEASAVTDDNVDWTFSLTVNAGQTKRLATFTVLGDTRADAIASVNALVGSNGFLGEAASFLTAGELASIANFQFNQAPTDIQLSSSSIAENNGVNALVATLVTVDPNLSVGDSHTYALVGGPGSTDNGSFTIAGNELRANSSFDFEVKNNYLIRIRSTDVTGATYEESFTIIVTDVDDTPPLVTGASFLNSGTLSSGATSLQVSFSELVTFSLGSQQNPARSAWEIKQINPSASDGIYWIDPDGAGSTAPFQVYCDMTTDGGGWMLAVNSLLGSEPASNDIISNTGIVGLTTAQTRNLDSYFAGTANAEVRHDIDGTNVGQGRFHGKYMAQSYQEPFVVSIFLSGHDNSNLLQGSFNSPFTPGNPGGSPWFYSGSLMTTMPASPALGSSGPVHLSTGHILNYQRIWVRSGAVGSDMSNNYELRRAGADGLLGNSDDPIIPITSATYATATNTATLNFAGLAEDVYRLTVKDAIVDQAGNVLDGDGNGTAGGNWRKDFVVDTRQSGLDPLFGQSGKITTDFGVSTSTDRAKSVAVQSDGKIVVAGHTQNGATAHFALVRYNIDGTLDTTFDGDGKVTTSIGSSSDIAQSVVVQSDGKIIVAGYSLNGSNYDFALARYNSNGTLDTTFDNDGKLTTAVGTSNDNATSVALQSDGKIVVAGYSYNGSNNDIALVRYNVNGTLDTAFDGDGKLSTSVGSLNDVAFSVAIQNDGRIVVAGYEENGSNTDFALVRYNVDGSLDTTFDDDGKLTTAIGSSYDYASSLVLQNDGKIVVAGYSHKGGSDFDIALARYDVNGTLDATFDVDGKLTTAIGTGNDDAESVALQSDGKIVVAGFSHNGSNNDFALVRYDVNGNLDSTFDGDGKLTFAFGSSHDVGTGMALQDDGKIIVAGYAFNGSNNDVALARVSDNVTNLTLQSTGGQNFEIDRNELGSGQLLQGPNNTSDGLNRLEVAGVGFSAIPGQIGTMEDAGQTFISSTTVLAGLSTLREITVPSTGPQDFARTIEVFSNPTGSAISVPVKIVGNLGSDAATMVFATSDGDLLVEPTDLWFATDDDNATGGTSAIVHLLHGPFGLQPTAVSLTDDNTQWNYNLTVGPGETKRLASFTILGATRQQAIDAASALVTSTAFGGQAAAFLSSGELASLANFHFNSQPTDLQLSSTAIAENNSAGAVVGTLTSIDANSSEGDTFTYSLVTGAGDTNNAAFSISGNQLTANAAFDFETKNNYSVRVRTTDSGDLFFEQTFTINVTNVPEAATVTVTSGDVTYNRTAYVPSATVSGPNGAVSNPTLSYAYFVGGGTSGTSLGAVSPSTVGTYTVVATYAGDANYLLSSSDPFTFQITALPLTPVVTVADKNFDGNALASISSRSLTGVVSGDLVSLVGGTATFIDATAGLNKQVNVANYSLSGNDAFNYSVPINTTTTANIFLVPQFSGVVINGGQSQRSQLTSVVVNFSAPVLLATGAFSLVNRDNNTSIAAFQLIISPNSGSAASFTITFGSGAGVQTRGIAGGGNSLLNGNYQLTIDASKVTSSTGTPLASNQVIGGTLADQFFRLFGDNDGDGDVDGTDLIAANRAYKLAVSASNPYNAGLDFNGDGVTRLDAVDSSAFTANYGKKRKLF